MTTAPKILTQTVVRHDEERSSIAPGRYIWRGPANAPVFLLQNCRDFLSSRVDVTVETPCSAVVVCERTKDAPGTIPSTNNGFHRWRIFGNGLAERGFWYRATVDANNEHGEFDANTVYGCGLPFVFEGQQSKHHRLTHNVVESFTYGVLADSAFDWQGGTLAVGACAFVLNNVGDPVRVASVGVEAVTRLLVTSGPTTAAQSVVLDSVRYEADQVAPDGEAIVMWHAGPLTIIGGRYGGGKQPIPRIALRGVGIQSVELVGRPHFGSYGAHAVNPIIAQNPPEALVTGGYLAQRAEGDPSNTAFIGSPTVERIPA